MDLLYARPIRPSMLEIRRRSHAHEILEGELFADFISVNRGLGNKGRPGDGIIEIDIL